MTTRRPSFAKCLAIACLGFAAMSAQALELRGFRGVAWGEGAEALREAAVTQTDGAVTCYQRERENLIFGNSALNGVRYCFRQDRLVMVLIDAAVDSTTLITEFERTYGRADAQRGLAASWGGKSSKTLADVATNGSSGARLAIYSNQVDAATARRGLAMQMIEAPRRVAGAF